MNQAKGMHLCKYCYLSDGTVVDQSGHLFYSSSSGDITLRFPNGDTFELPDAFFHYLMDHDWHPPEVFIQDVLMFDVEKVQTSRLQTKSPHLEMKIGYLEGDYPKGEVSEIFKDKMLKLLEKALADYPWLNNLKRQNKGE